MGRPSIGKFSDEIDLHPPIDELTSQCRATVERRAPTYFRCVPSKKPQATGEVGYFAADPATVGRRPRRDDAWGRRGHRLTCCWGRDDREQVAARPLSRRPKRPGARRTSARDVGRFGRRGRREDLPDNAVRQAHTPNFDRWWVFSGRKLERPTYDLMAFRFIAATIATVSFTVTRPVAGIDVPTLAIWDRASVLVSEHDDGPTRAIFCRRPPQACPSFVAKDLLG